MSQSLEAQLQQRAKDDAAIALLQTHPGIELLTSLALRYTLLPTSRFRTTLPQKSFASALPSDGGEALPRRSM